MTYFEPLDCGQEADAETLYAEGRSSRAALDFVVACLGDDEERAAELMHPAVRAVIGLPMAEWIVEFGTNLSFDLDNDFGAVTVEPVALDREAVHIADLTLPEDAERYTPVDVLRFALLMERDPEHGWRLRGFGTAGEAGFTVDGSSESEQLA